MYKALKVVGGLPTVISQAVVEFAEIDPAAEFILCFDYTFANNYSRTYKYDPNIQRIVVPFEYATNGRLIVGIVDSDKVYDGYFITGVIPEIINANAP